MCVCACDSESGDTVDRDCVDPYFFFIRVFCFHVENSRATMLKEMGEGKKRNDRGREGGRAREWQHHLPVGLGCFPFLLLFK